MTEEDKTKKYDWHLSGFIAPPSGIAGAGQTGLTRTLPPKETQITWCYDRELAATPEMLTKFRTTNDLSVLDESLKKTGLESLRMSGSASLSTPEQIDEILNLSGNDEVWDIDLREESHGIAIAEGKSYGITLRGWYDWANVGMSHDEIIVEEQKVLDELSQQDEVTLTSFIDLKKIEDKPRLITLQKPQILTERQLVESANATYHRICSTDHVRPSRAQVDRFIDIAQKFNDYKEAKLKEGKKVGIHFHCFAGAGRTSTYMTMFDMLHNAQSLSFEEIMDRQEKLNDFTARGASKKAWKNQSRKEREDFLQEFYNYARENPLGKPKIWSEWRLAHKDLAAIDLHLEQQYRRLETMLVDSQTAMREMEAKAKGHLAEIATLKEEVTAQKGALAIKDETIEQLQIEIQRLQASSPPIQPFGIGDPNFDVNTIRSKVVHGDVEASKSINIKKMLHLSKPANQWSEALAPHITQKLDELYGKDGWVAVKPKDRDSYGSVLGGIDNMSFHVTQGKQTPQEIQGVVSNRILADIPFTESNLGKVPDPKQYGTVGKQAKGKGIGR